ncbi:hypothetical protein P6709_20420, partial [Jeotgalibacillus sp. ET6]|uniref:hypothetical protein n=1 Tax=Jeotgalibacillus sp. ET6 TaxID=3037260 RepID=UPI0024187E21
EILNPDLYIATIGKNGTTQNKFTPTIVNGLRLLLSRCSADYSFHHPSILLLPPSAFQKNFLLN